MPNLRKADRRCLLLDRPYKMIQPFKIYLFLIASTLAILTTSCRSTKPFFCTFQNPLDHAYDSLMLKDTIHINSIRDYKKYIDSLIENDDHQTYVVRSIAEGTIKQEILKTSKVGHTNKLDTTKEIRNGGFGKYTYDNQKGDTIFKILYHDNIDKNFYESFYFKDNKLIFASISYEENGIGNTFYSRQEYYNNYKLILVEETKNQIEQVYRQRVSFDLMQKGKDYLKEYYDDKN